jgi:hypothetical protein
MSFKTGWVLLALALAEPLDAQLARNCGNTGRAEEWRQEMLRYFTAGGEFDELRAGRWDKLPPNVSNSVVSKPPDCRRIVDAANQRLTELYPPGHSFFSEPTWHYLYDIGPYYVVVLGILDSVGRTPMLILRKTDYSVVWVQLV